MGVGRLRPSPTRDARRHDLLLVRPLRPLVILSRLPEPDEHDLLVSQAIGQFQEIARVGRTDRRIEIERAEDPTDVGHFALSGAGGEED